MEAPPVDRPMQPVDQPVTPQETVEVLGDPDILARISGRLPLREQQRLERVSRDVQQAVQEVGARREQRLHELTADPRMQQLALHARGHLQAPFVRSGFIPGMDYAPALAGAETDVELVTETLGNYAGVTPEQRRRDMLDGRWMALHTDEPGAARPHLVDRMGRPIDRGRPEQPAVGMARATHTVRGARPSWRTGGRSASSSEASSRTAARNSTSGVMRIQAGNL